MAKDKRERLQKILEQLQNENEAIQKSKAKIKLLNEQKKKLEKQIQDDEYRRLREALNDYGIKNTADFQNFIKENSIAQELKTEPTE